MPLPRLAEPRELAVALRIRHDAGWPRPDFLNSIVGGEGWVTHTELNRYKAIMSFLGVSRPLALLAIYATLTFLFFYLWSTAPREREYAFMSLYMAVCSLVKYTW